MTGGLVVNEVMRRLARDRWVRLHGTPRVTVIFGADVRAVYLAWLALGTSDARLHEGDDLDRSIRDACAHASAHPTDTVAVYTRHTFTDRLRRANVDAVVRRALTDHVTEESARDPKLWNWIRVMSPDEVPLPTTSHWLRSRRRISPLKRMVPPSSASPFSSSSCATGSPRGKPTDRWSGR